MLIIQILTTIHVLLTIGLIGLILLQRGKGADIGAAFGSGASSTVFGSQGSASFLTRTTAVLATLFFVMSLTLAYLSGQRVEQQSVTEFGAPPPEVDLLQSDMPHDLPVDLPEIPSVPDSLDGSDVPVIDTEQQ